MSILAGLGAAAASFAMKEGHNAIAQSRNEKNMALEQDYWKQRVNYLNELNKPSRQVAKWRSAGIAPQAVFGNSPGGAGIATDASSPNSQTPTGSSDFNFVTTIAERQRMKNEKAITDAEVNLKNAQAEEARSRTTGQENENSIFELIKSAKQSAAGVAALEEKIKGIEAKWLEAEKAKDMEIKDSILRETDQRISNLMSDKAYREQATEKLRSDMDLIKAQIATESSKQHNLDAQTKTEDALREGRVSLTSAQADELLSMAGLNDVKRDREKYETFLRLLDIDDASNGAEFAQRIIRQLLGRMNADLSDYKRKMISDYLEKIWSNQKP